MKDEEDGELLTGGSRLWSGQRERAHPWLPPSEKVTPLKPEPPDERTYVAFDTHDRADCIQIERATLPSRLPSYSYLLDASYDHHHHSALTLFYSFMVVEIIGRNLYPVIHAIKYRMCDHIRQFNPQLHDQPADDQPIITEINIHTANNLSDPEPK